MSQRDGGAQPSATTRPGCRDPKAGSAQPLRQASLSSATSACEPRRATGRRLGAGEGGPREQRGPYAAFCLSVLLPGPASTCQCTSVVD